MNSDRRRILGPADAVRPLLPPRRPSAPDAGPAGVRSFFVKTGLGINANGSAYLEVGDTIVEVGVFGPRPIRGSFIERASFSVETKFLPYVVQPNEALFNGSASSAANVRSGLSNIEHKISTYIETAFLPALVLEKYPKSTIDVFVNVLAFNSAASTLPNLLAWVVNCTSLALVDSGIELRDLVTGGHVRAAGDTLLLDAPLNSHRPDVSDHTQEPASAECVACFMVMKNSEMVAIWLDGNDEGTDASADVLVRALDGCKEMSTLVRQNINGYLLGLADEES